MWLEGAITVLKRSAKRIKQFSFNNRIPLLIFLGLFSLVGIASLLLTRANTFSVAVEPENAAITSPAIKITDQNASGGSLIQFGSQSLATDPYDLASTAGYTLPTGANVKFVSPNGNDTAAGNETAPFKTVTKAVASVTAGGTVVLRGGIHNSEPASVPKISKQITIQAYPGEKPWIDGARQVNGFVSDGTIWRKDSFISPELCHNYDTCVTNTVSGNFRYWVDGKVTCNNALVCGSLGAEVVDESYVDGLRSAWLLDQIFVNGAALSEIACNDSVATCKGQVGPGKFWINKATQQLFIGDNPAGKTIESTQLAWGLWLTTSTGPRIKGVGFSRFAGSAHNGSASVTPGALVVNAPGANIDNVVVKWSAGTGVAMYAGNITMNNLKVAHSGFVGLRINNASGGQILGGVYDFNNRESFNVEGPAATAAAIKAANTAGGLTVNGASISNNNANGLWCDLGCDGAKFVKNIIKSNSKSGIHYEISTGGIIAGNLIIDSTKLAKQFSAGIKVASSTNTKVYNNTLVSNRAAFGAYNNGRVDIANIAIRNNVFSDSTGTYLHDAACVSTCTQLVQDMGLGYNFNMYHRTTTKNPPTYVNWNNRLVADIVLSTLADLRSRGLEADGFEVNGGNIFRNITSGDYKLSTPRSGEALPADVASALGVAAGSVLPIGY
ncbi:MAG: right-handed parallel beta-helix repeat-containing protein [Patescibacteria group bacterium]